MTQYLYNDLDWNFLLDNLLSIDGVAITTDPNKWNLATPEYLEIYKIWKDANFNVNSIKWINYYPGTHFPIDVSLKIADYLKIKHIRSWISRIDPGYYAPWHWDVDDNEQEYLNFGEIHRYSVFIEPPTFGHIFILGNDYIINQPQGSIVKWNNHREWHSGINAGMKPKFMFHILGHQLP